MSTEDNNEAHITVRELDARIASLEAKIVTAQYKGLLALGAAVGLIRFDLPAEITVGAILAVAGKALWAFLARS